MTIDDAPMDELDLAIRREAAALRSQVDASAATDSAWVDFVGARTAPVIRLGEADARRNRRRMAVAIGMVAALIATVVIVRQLLDDDSTRQPIIRPAPDLSTVTVESTAVPETVPTTTPALGDVPSIDPPYSAVMLNGGSDLVAVGTDGVGARFTTIPPSEAGLYVKVDLSNAGWVAETGLMSEGFWFYNLRDPEGTRRFVALAGPSSGSTSRGTWSPDGTLYAAVERDTTAAVIDPKTGLITRRPSTNPPVGYPPTWTEDGKGILTGEPAPTCLEPGADNQRTLSIVWIAGGAEQSWTIPGAVYPIADGFNGFGSGTWASDDLCGTPPSDGSQQALTDVAVVDATSLSSVATPWIAATDVAPGLLRDSVFASQAPELWVVAERGPGDRFVQLYRVTGPGQYEVVNTLTAAVAEGSYVMIAGVAPDNSAVVVHAIGPSDRGRFYLMPTDGSPPTTLDGEFGGFVPTSLIEDLP